MHTPARRPGRLAVELDPDRRRVRTGPECVRGARVVARALTALALACVASAPAAASDDNQLWNMWFGQGDLGGTAERRSPWRWWLDVHARFRSDAEDLDSLFLRPGVGRAIADDMVLWLGYAYFHMDPAGRDSFREERLWQQLTFPVQTPLARLLGRTRLEQRFFEDQSDTGWRFRQFFKATVPLAPAGGLFLSLWDEAFYDLNDTDFGQRVGLRQNRAFVGLGFGLDDSPRTSVEIGYLNQWLDRPSGDVTNHILSLNVFMTF